MRDEVVLKMPILTAQSEAILTIRFILLDTGRFDPKAASIFPSEWSVDGPGQARALPKAKEQWASRRVQELKQPLAADELNLEVSSQK